MTDDLAIAIAVLHGLEFESYGPYWYVAIDNPDSDRFHPIENANSAESGRYGFHTRAALARAYIKHYNLEG